MITECVIWTGSFVSTYQDEVDEWFNKGDETDKEYHHCSDIWMDDDNDIWVDSGGLFDGKVVLLIGAEDWKSGDTQWVLNKYEEMSGEVRVGIIYRQGGDPPKKVAEWATEEVRDRGIPFDAEEQADWIREWLADRDVTITHKTAKAVADHVRYDIGKLVEGLIMIVNGARGEEVSTEQIIQLLGPLGETDIYDLTNAILSGDRAGAAEALQRLEHMGYHYLLAVIVRRMRAYCAIAFDVDTPLDVFGIYGGAQYYVKREAKGLTPDAAARILAEIAEAEHRLKGGSRGMSDGDNFMVLVDNLTTIYQRSVR